jgi:hypothetical protein
VNPRAFVCHAREDKERFVLDFATKLRQEKGIDAWLDVWEMLPGDSIVDKIFEEGIPNAQAGIVVVSEHSVNKPWVRAELNATVVKSIEGKIRLIPIVIGSITDSQVPEALKTTVWERIRDLNNYDAELNRIANSIYGLREKPALGAPPVYVRTTLDNVPGLNKIDSLILKLSCEMLMQEDNHRHSPLRPETVVQQAESKEIPRDTTLDSLQMLAEGRYIDTGNPLGSRDIAFLLVTDYDFDQYARVYLPGYDELTRNVALQIVNLRKQRSEDIADALKLPHALVEHVIALFAQKNYITAMATGEGPFHILDTHPRLRRWLQGTS